MKRSPFAGHALDFLSSPYLMRTRTIWVFGVLASVTVGGMIGIWLLQAGPGSAAWGAAAGALTFVCFRSWPPATSNELPEAD
jgi:hypothetical protein